MALKESLSLVEFHVVISQSEQPDMGARNCPLEEQYTFNTADHVLRPSLAFLRKVLPNIESLELNV